MNSNTSNSPAPIAKPISFKKLMPPLMLSVASIMASNTPAMALSFNFTFSDNTPLEVRTVFWEAGDAWSKQLTDDVVVNVFVDYGTLPSNVLAGSRPGMTRVTYSEFHSQLSQDTSSQDGSKYISQDYDDARTLSRLQNSSSFKYLRNAYNTTNNSWNDKSTEVDTEDKIWLTRANAKALSIINHSDGSYNDFDASIRISNTANWHYDIDVAAPSGKHDLITVAVHEIGHALGFVSGNDAFQLLSAGGNLTTQNLDHFTPVDLFRYSEQSKALGIPDWTKEQTYFSLDSGSNNLGGFSQGAKIDGYQAGHWKQGESRGIMSPFLNTGERWEISELDRRLLDAIGWDRADQLSKNVAAVMLEVDWNTSEPDLSMLENSLKAHLSLEMEKLRQERDAIQSWSPSLWSELKLAADEEFQKRQQAIQETLNKIRVEKYNPSKRMEEALNGTDIHLKALADLAQVYEVKLQASLDAQITSWLNDSTVELKDQLKTVTQLQLRRLAAKVRNAGSSQHSEWKNDIKEALRLLYQEMHASKTPSQVELNTALAKLLDAAAPDNGFGWSEGSGFWQTGNTKSSFEQTGEFTFHSNAGPEKASVKAPTGAMGMLGLGLFSIGFLLKRSGKRSSGHNPSLN